MKAAIIITNYNMPEAVDAMAEALKQNCPDHRLYDFVVVDNGSDLVPPSHHTVMQLERNVQTTGGWLAGYHWAQSAKNDYDAYIFTITSTSIPEQDKNIVAGIFDTLERNPDAVIVSPALTDASTTSWNHMKVQGKAKVREVPFVDNLFCAYRADWFDQNPFDPSFAYAWGSDLEQCYKARLAGRKILINQTIKVQKITNIGYSMNRMNMDAATRQQLAGNNMREVMQRKYGDNWHNLMYGWME